VLPRRESRKFKSILLAFAGLALSLLICTPVSAQVVGATLSGTVTDMSGAILPQAQIVIKNVATGVSSNIMTNADGFYSAPNLLPGAYEMTASAPGFATEVRTGITLTVGAQQVLNFILQVGEITQKVEVSGEALTVELVSSTISGVVSSNTVVELPLNGRSWSDLAALQPGVDAITTQVALGPARGLRGFGAEDTISGARPSENNYRLNGISMNDYSNAGPGSVLGGNLGVDAIQEFSVLTTNYSAEYGKTAGGVVNAIMRSGTNQFHGSAYEFIRNIALDARNFFNGPTKPPFRRNQFGASAGAPIQKDRTFVFADYEGIRQFKGISVIDIVPSPAARAGNLCSVPLTPTSCTPNTAPVNSAAQAYLPLFPLPNAGLIPGGNGDTGHFDFAQNQIVSENFFTTRIDHKFSEKDSIFGSWMYDNTPFTLPDSADNYLVEFLTARQLYTIEETHIFSASLVNTVRFGFNREVVNDDVPVSAINPAAADMSLSAIPGRDAPRVTIGGGLTSILGGLNSNSYFPIHWNTFQGYDDASLTRGTHSLKFGFAVERMQDDNAGVTQPGGTFNFSNFANFLANIPSRFTAQLPTTVTERGFRQTLFGGYIQDDWRWRPNLTFNLGLRYEMVTVPTEVHGALENLVNISDPMPQCGILVAGCASVGPFQKNNTLRNFEPRVGFAWDPFKTGKTSVRGGFGMFDNLPMLYTKNFAEDDATPFALLGAVTSPKLPPGSFFTGGLPLLTASSATADYFQQDPRRNYVMQWNLNVQRQIAPGATVMIGYVGSRGVHMPYEVDDADMVIPTLTSAGYLYPAPIGSGTKINPNFGDINAWFYQGNSFYDALLVQVTKAMSHGIQFQASYTWGKSIDTSSSDIQGNDFSNGVGSLDWFDPKLTRGLSDFDQGRTLVASVNWQVPSAKSLSGPAAWALSGWELGAIFTAKDGEPFTVTYGTNGDSQGEGNSDVYAFPNVLGGSGCANLVNPGNPNNYVKTQCFALPTAPNMAFWTANCDTTSRVYGSPLTTEPFPVCFNLRGNEGRNKLIGPGLTDLDFSVFKNNYIKRISETFNAQFRMEVFNILNHPNFGPSGANGDVFNAAGTPISTLGELNTTTTDAREIQFALKFVW
jgi:hypothetical protein